MADQTALRFDGRVALVTGAGRGLGRAYAQLLGSRGARVVVNDLGVDVTGGGPSSQAAEDTVAAITEAGGEAVANADDVSTTAGAATAVAAAVSRFGRLDIVVNNAGLSGGRPFEELDDASLGTMLEVHAGGTFRVTKAAWPHLARSGSGRIVNVTSGAALFGSRGLSAYSAGKGAILGMTRTLALEGETHGIRVNAIAPTAYTRMAERIQDDTVRTMFQEHLQPSQVSPMVAYLSHESCAVSGQIFDVGGGHFARVAIGVGRGYLDPAATVEDVRDHLDEILSVEPLTLPNSGESAVGAVVQRLGGGE